MPSSTSAPTFTADIVPAPEAGIPRGPAVTLAQHQQEAPLVVHLQPANTGSQSSDNASGNVLSPNGVVPQVHPSPTHPSDLLNVMHQGPWLEIHRNFVSYVLHTLELYDGSLNKIVKLSKQWAKWDVLTSLANYRFVVQILFGYLTESSNLAHDSAVDISNRLSADVSCVLRQMNSILSDRATYKHFLCCRGAAAQQLLDLLQDLLDSSHELTSRALFSKALLRLSGKCELHPTCFIITGAERMGQQVAGGGFGDIRKGSVGGQTVAVKSMRQFKDDDVKVSMKKLGREALIWRQLSHPNLLPFFGLYMLDNRLCLISPWMDNGDLKDFLKNAPADIDHISLMVDVARGLDYLHSQDVVHGDLKPVNILVTPSGKACISDFGLSTIVDALSLKMSFSSRSGRAGTIRYQAPELLKNESSTHFGSDIYAFACVGYEILTGKVPFYEVANEAAVICKVVIDEARPSGLEMIFPDHLRLLLEGCWHRKAETRPTSTDILRRLLSQPMGDEIRGSHPADWDYTYSARFRRSIQEWPLFPSIAEVEQRLLVNTGEEETTKIIETRTNIDVTRTLPWFVKTRDIRLGAKIGSGGFSVVYKGRWLTRDMHVAVKVFREPDAINELLDEVFIWRSFDHPNLHPFLGAAPFENPAFVVSPLCINGNALEYLLKNPQADKLQILHDIGRGMEYLHAQNVVHGDLKARNVLINDQGHALVADFGLAKFARVSVKSAIAQSPNIDSTPTTPKMVNVVGTIHWLAPECFVEGGSTRASDAWAMGMCAYELFTEGKIPLVEIAADDLGQRLLDGTRPSRVDAIPDSAWTIMERCWAHEPLTRPTFSQLCLVLGVFQDSDIESLQEASEGFAGENWSGSELSGWPGLAERLIAILTSVLKIDPVQSVSENTGVPDDLFSLSAQSQSRVVSALRALITLSRFSSDDISVGSILIGAGALPALLFILQHRSKAVDAEILRLGCEILDGLSQGYASETLAVSLASSDFIKVLVKLAGEAEIQTARKALDTAGKLVLSKRTFEEESEKKLRAITLDIIPRLLEVFRRKDSLDAIVEACNFACMLALPPVALSLEHVGDILGALVPLVLHKRIAVRLSVMKTIETVLFCHPESEVATCGVVKDGELANVVLDLTEHITSETPMALVQGCLDILSAISTTSNVPRLVGFLSLREINALLVTVAVLKDVGNRCGTETKNELAKTHDLFTTLTPLLKSPDETVSRWSNEAVSAFSTLENIPLFISFLKGEDERLKLMAIRILKVLVAGVSVSEDQKLAVVHSGVLSDLHHLLRKQSKATGDENLEDSSQQEMLPDATSQEAVISSGGEQSASNSESNQGPVPDPLLGSATLGPALVHLDTTLDGPTTPSDSKQPDSMELSSEPVVDTSVIRQPAYAAMAPPAIDRAIELRDSAFAILDAIATNASDHGMEIIADAYVEVGIHASLVDLLKEPAHDPTFPWPDDPNRRNCIRVLHELARGTDFAKREIIKTDIFLELRRIMDSDSPNSQQARLWCCLMLYHLLSSDEVNEDIVLAVINAGLLERLVSSLKIAPVHWMIWEPISAAQVISCLVMSTADNTWDKLREQNAINCLREFLQTLEAVENLFTPRTWMLVEYLDHPQLEAQKFGLFLVNWLLKGGVAQRKSVTNMTGMRDALEKCLKSEDDDVRARAKDLISKWPNMNRRR
ncbi:Protein kinase domain-containing protein [Mycena sanguinolenta]|uniref:Protein kinase domain-containing protein n=1 Tax=Mycena sanguinolenta TaxID=230812 RepID=A0A8H6YAP4_9AGAR|nr:Protein kinase domain-containing protein [Mycena sanguinolenta]